MPTVRRSGTDVEEGAELADLAKRRAPTDAEIEAQAAEDGDAWTDEELADAEAVWPPPSPAELRALRHRLGLSQARFARRFGFSVDTVRQYEQGRRTPTGPAVALLRVIGADPDVVARALRGRKAG